MNRFFGNSVRFLILGLIVTTLGSCKTTKNTFLNRNYHSTATRYNWYYNAKLNFHAGQNKLQEEHKDDYNQLLRIYPLGTKKEAQSIAPQMDKALKKCASAISKHSMLIKGEERNRWIDDCYLLIGKAYYYKQEYIKAIEAFRLVGRQFQGNISAYESQIWLLRSFVEEGDLGSAELVIENIVMDETFPTSLNQPLSLALADYYLKTEDKIMAIEELSSAIDLTKKRREKARYHFLLAQLQAEEGNYAEATNLFTKVIRSSPDYEMVFNAKINRARSFDTSSGGTEEIVKELKRMLKDDKNAEYLDVIYYGLAELNKREDKMPLAIQNYTLSVAKSVKNDAQKALSSSVLADLYYQKQNYRLAQAYYDTAVAFMNNKHQRFQVAQLRQKTLTDLITNLDVIYEQDSIQRIALMPEGERMAFIDNLIRQIELEEKKEKELENQRRSENNFFTDPSQRNNKFNNNIGGQWYFENPNTLSFGYSEFNRKWGKRKLEDDWRRSNKKSMTVEEALADTLQEDVFDPKNRDSYVKGLPLTTEAMKASNRKIIAAYFDAGVIYKEQLEDIPQAIQSFETLNKRFPINDNRVMVLYFLNRLHAESQDTQSANTYKNTLLEEFPNSDYAKLLKDPDYINQLSDANTSIEQTYEQAFALYNKGLYNDCLQSCKVQLAKYPNHYLGPHFDLLKTMAEASQTNKPIYIAKLEGIINTYPNHQVALTAQEIITLLQTQDSQTTQDEQQEGAPYTTNAQAAHYFILLFYDYNLELALAKAALSDYHAEYYRLDRLNISNLLFEEHTHMITVREFINQQAAMDYYQAFQEGDVRGVFGDDYQAFVIAGPNFPYFFKNKDTEGYLKMFKQHYQ